MKRQSKDIFWIGDRYCGLFKIGSGGMGEVWAGKSIGDKGFERTVAIKRLHPDNVRRESHHRAILDEAAILQHISSSPNIVSVLDLRVEDGQPALIMEYIDGPELKDVLEALTQKKKPLPSPIAFYIVIEISKGLSSAHQCKHPKTGNPLNIVHRDVSPSNVLLSSQGAVMLTDFGIAKSEIQTAQTMVGEIKGKFQYMSPEQARGKKIDYRTDYFALGLIFYECLFGKPAYEADTDAAFIEKARSGKITYPANIPKDLKSVFEHLLAIDPNNRYSDLEQFRRDLGKVAMDHSGIGTSDDLRKFLNELNIPQLREAIERRINLDNFRDVPDREELAATGAYVEKRFFQHRGYKLVSIFVFIIVILSAGYFFMRSKNDSPALNAGLSTQATMEKSLGSLAIQTSPEGAAVVLTYGNYRVEDKSPAVFKDLPLDTPLKIAAQKADFLEVKEEVQLTKAEPQITRSYELKKKPSVQVRFTANPPSSVTIPGRLTDQAAPSPIITLPAGRYNVIYSNPLATSTATAVLNAEDGGAYTCSANMEIDAGTSEPSGKKPSAFCVKKR